MLHRLVAQLGFEMALGNILLVTDY